jgi:LPS-assembly protein
MLRKFIATVILVASLHAQDEKFEIIANDVKTRENNVVVATGNVVIYSKTYYITAQKIIYDKEKETFELFDDVMILRNNNVQSKSDYAFLDMKNDGIYQKPTMYYDESTSVWISSNESDKKKEKIYIEDSIVSSCDCIDPDWSIRSSSADYDTEDKWINIYNPRIYMKDIPLFYSPYLGFSTDKSRRTGLLMPSFGLSSSEGTFFSQPIYFAPAKNYDIEFIPQIRSARGLGLYTYFRYADSPDSIFELSSGYFKEKSDYVKEYNLRNTDHYGFDLKYERYNLFNGKKLDTTDGIYVDLNYLNDIEYKTLENEKYRDDVESKIESRINYIYNTPNYFLGSYFRYYIDTTKDSNATTLQELPKVQLHSYSRPLFLDKLLYSADLKVTNHFRRDGISANQYELNAPLSYSFSLLDDYLNFEIKHSLSLNRFNYSNFSTTKYEDGTFAETNTTLSLNSDLIKPYDDYIHSVNLFTDFNKANTIKENGDLIGVNLIKIDNPISTNDLNNNQRYDELSSFPVAKSQDTIAFGLNHSFYDKNSLEEIIKHKIKQTILYEEDNPKLQNLENEIVYNYILGSMKNKFIYNQQDKKFVESSTSFSLNYNNFYLKLGHYLARQSANAGFDENLESYTIDSRYKLSNRYSIGYSTRYNIEENLRTNQTFKFSINDSCWDLNLKYKNEITAASTNNNLGRIEQDIVYIELFLKPLGGVMQEYEINKDN